jgi:hypothetical protein
MSHPLESIPRTCRKRLFIGFLVSTVILLAVFQLLDLPLITSAAPYGIVSHQFAWTVEKAKVILAPWDSKAVQFAAFGLGLDYLFMVLYGSALALGSLLASERHRGWFSLLGAWVAWSVFVAVIFDVLENFGQGLQLLGGTVTAPITLLVGIFATMKFTLLFLSILYGIVGWLIPKTMES